MDNVKKFRKIAEEVGNLYEKKNAAYGNSFGETYQKLGIVSAVTRISDKYNRLCILAKNPDVDDCDVCDIPNCNVDLETQYENYLGI